MVYTFLTTVKTISGREISVNNNDRTHSFLSVLPLSRKGGKRGALTLAYLLFITVALSVSACTSVTIDHYRHTEISNLEEQDTIVILGRRTASDYETEVNLIDCIGDGIRSGKNGINVIPEREFMDELYPWFEPRIAPMHIDALKQLSQREEIASVLEHKRIRYFVWIDGKTETTGSTGSIGCSIGIGAGGCFGFGTWDKESEYEATIWDYNTHELMGKISADASGTSYMPALFVPIPIVARVQSNACKAMASQLKDFFNPQEQKSN